MKNKSKKKRKRHKKIQIFFQVEIFFLMTFLPSVIDRWGSFNRELLNYQNLKKFQADYYQYF